MDFMVTQINVCDGGNHVRLTATVNGRVRVIDLDQEEFAQREFDDIQDSKEAVVARMRSAIKEAGATTAQQIRTAVLNRDFKV